MNYDLEVLGILCIFFNDKNSNLIFDFLLVLCNCVLGKEMYFSFDEFRFWVFRVFNIRYV